MEGYERAYRDPGSPLTPLTPLAENPNFRFDFDVDKLFEKVTSKAFPSENYKPSSAVKYPRTPLTSTTIHDNANPLKPRSFSKNFKHLQNFFKPQQQKICDIKITKSNSFETDDSSPELCLENEENETPKILKFKHNYQYVRQHDSHGNLLRIPARAKNVIKQRQEVADMSEESNLGHKLKQKSLKECSPILHRPLSPRTGMLLTNSGLSHYKSLFQREEIDLMVFGMLTSQELQDLGVTDAEDRQRILEVAKHSQRMF